jgi:predicted house-cleaning noncanonical NTP pyrophosphatase (MazG superfamily)
MDTATAAPLATPAELRILREQVECMLSSYVRRGRPDEEQDAEWWEGKVLETLADRLERGSPADSLEQVAVDAATWAAETFPNADNNSVAEHLLREVVELSSNPTDPEELADVFLLLSRLALTNGVDLAAAARAKLEKNRRRSWGEPDSKGVVEHVSEGATHA